MAAWLAPQRHAQFAACATLPRAFVPCRCQTRAPATSPFGRTERDAFMKKFKLEKPTGTTVVLILLSMLGMTIYGAITVGLASQIGKPPGVVPGVTADE